MHGLSPYAELVSHEGMFLLIYLIGADHVIQHWGYLDSRKEVALREFQWYLEKIVHERDIGVIAEEFSESALNLSNTEVSSARKVAQALAIEHRFCDPTSEERKVLNIKDDEQREREWLNCLQDLSQRNVLFICGSSHLQSFPQLLIKKGFEVKILSDKWGYDYLGKGSVEYFDGTGIKRYEKA